MELQTLQHLLVPQDCIWPTVSQFVQIAQDYDSLDCILDMVLSLTQVMPQKYLIWKQNRSACSVLGCWRLGKGLWISDWKGSVLMWALTTLQELKRLRSLSRSPWLLQETLPGDSGMACSPRQPWSCLRAMLWLSVWPFECHLGCHAELGTSTRVWPQPAQPTWESPAVSAGSNPTAIYFTWMTPFTPEVPVIQGWVNPNPSQRCCWNSPFPGPRDPVLTLPGWCSYCTQWPDFD